MNNAAENNNDLTSRIVYVIPFVITFILISIIFFFIYFTSFTIYDIISFIGIICASLGFLTSVGYNLYYIHRMHTDTNIQQKPQITISPYADLTATPFIMNFSIVGFFIWFILYWNFTKKNWDTEKCKKNNFYIAPIFGENSETTFTDCLTKDSTGIINAALNPLSQDILALKNEISNGRKNGIGNNGVNSGYLNSNSSDYSSSLNSGIYGQVQKNMIHMKSALNKLTGSAIASQYVNDGAIKTSTNFKDNNIDIWTKMNTIDPKDISIDSISQALAKTAIEKEVANQSGV